MYGKIKQDKIRYNKIKKDKTKQKVPKSYICFFVLHGNVGKPCVFGIIKLGNVHNFSPFIYNHPGARLSAGAVCSVE